MTYTTNGVAQIGHLDPYVRVEGETFNAQGGVETEPCSEGDMNLTELSDGDWVKIVGVDFRAKGANKFSAVVASAGPGGSIELRLGGLDGKLIGTCKIENDSGDFSGMMEHREGPETCNTHNMLRLTRQLFASRPDAAYADYYERALYNHILASINTRQPGYVYFTPIRPGHYRVYSQPDKGFWCCVGSGMENPGRYGEFIYAQATNGVYVNLFIASEVTLTNLGLTLRQETAFPDEPRTALTLKLPAPAEFALYLRHPGWVAPGAFKVQVNGKPVAVYSVPSSYAVVLREWRDGDRVEIALPMRTTVEHLPDDSDWVAILHGPIVLAAPSGTNDMVGLFADDSRMGQ